ncbi:MAG: hypothetical protein ACXV5T_06470 [Halobacteriota archaeon]
MPPTHEHARSLQPLHAADFVKQMLIIIAQEKLAAIREQVELVDDGQEIVCGIRTWLHQAIQQAT